MGRTVDLFPRGVALGYPDRHTKGTNVTEPAPTEGNNTTYAIIGILLLLLAGGGAYFMFGGKEPPPPPPPPAPAKRPTALAEPEMEIPEEIPDAGTPEPTKKKVIIKWVSGSWDCAGEVNPAQASAIVRENNKQVRNCYEHKLKANHNLQGRAMLTLKVDKNGAVAATKAMGNLGDNEVFACMQRVASTWRFPAPTGGSCAVVQAPFNFTPQK